MNAVIHKVAGVILRGGLLLVVRKRGTDLFLSPGGKPEPGEGAWDTLCRELAEETNTELLSARSLGKFRSSSALEAGSVEIEVFDAEVAGHPVPGAEIEEIAWIDADHAARGVRVGSVFAESVIPVLVREGRLRSGRPRAAEGVPLVVVDLDGTAVDPAGSVAEPVGAALRALRADPGVELVFATSRAPRGARAALGELYSSSTVLCCNGAVLSESGRVRVRRSLGEDTVRTVVDLLDADAADYYLDYGVGFAVARSDHGFDFLRDYAGHRVLRRDIPDWAADVVKIAVRGADSDRLRRELAAVDWRERPNVLVHRDGTVEIGLPGVNKGEALRDRFGTGRRVVAFGDDTNDLELLCAADRGYVVGEGLPELRHASHITTLPADRHEVAKRLAEVHG